MRVAARTAILFVTISILSAAGAPPVVNDGHGDFVYVPGGPFRMGDNFGDGESRERPVHVVDVDAFYIAKYEMTNGEWRKFRDDPGYEDPKFWPSGRVVPKDQVPYWTQAPNHGGGTPGRQLPAPRRQLGFGHRLLQLAERKNGQEISASH